MVNLDKPKASFVVIPINLPVDGEKTLKAQSPKQDSRRGRQNTSTQQDCYCKIYLLRDPFCWENIICQWAM